ncbi:MAG: dTDP-4-dehydrorhamnose reductase [Allosphingosinicella sp.]
MAAPERPRLLVVGRSGQLARSLAEVAPGEPVELVLAGRPEIDLLDFAGVARALADLRPSLVVNAAAYTDVDGAEDAPELAQALNALAPGRLAAAAAEAGARLIHVSTDYVFGGADPAGRARRPDDPTGPASVYGRTKLAGEAAVRAVAGGHVILRTAWLYSPFGRNFVKTMLDLARRQDQVRVVSDQVGSPTSALDFARAILRLGEVWRRDPAAGAGRTFHYAGAGSASWADFAREIFAQSRAKGGPWAEVVPIGSAEWPARAPRPADSRLDSEDFAATFGLGPRPWPEGLAEVVERLLSRVAACPD